MPSSKTMRAPLSKVQGQISNNWSITNDSDSDIIVINAFTEEDLPSEHFYEQSLKTLDTTNGQKFITGGSTGIISLDGATKKYGTGGTGNSAVYSSILARTDNLFPVKTIEVTLDSNTQAYPALTVTNDDVKNMQLAEKFQQVIRTFPKSALAQDFANVLLEKDPDKTDAFFAGTDEYKSLTLDMVVVIQTYYNVYPFVWADYKAGKSYQLYNSDGSANKFLGVISMSNKCAVPVGVDKPVPGFTITYESGDEYPDYTTLYYSDGQFVDDVNSESPGICLSGLFILQSQLTQKDTDTKITSVLRGTVNGNEVLGYETDQPVDKKGNPSILSSLFHPQDTKGWLELCAIIVGGTILLGILCKLAKMSVDAARMLMPDPAQAEIDRLNKEWLEEQARLMKTDQRFIDRLKLIEQSKIPESFKDYSTLLENETIRLSYEADVNNVTEIWTKQNSYLEMVLKYGRNDNIQEVSDKLGKIDDWLNTDKELSSFAENLDNLMNDFKANSAILNDAWVSFKNKSSIDMITVDKSTRAIEEFTRSIQENEKIRESWEESKVPEIIEEI